MDGHAIPETLRSLVQVRGVGCTGVTLRAVDVLVGIADDAALLRRCVEFLASELSGYATMWHLTNIVNGGDPKRGLRDFGERLRADARRSVEAAAALLAAYGQRVQTVPGSSLTRQVMSRLDDPGGDRAPGIGLAGADAIGPDELLNMVGTRDLAARLPTVIVTTSSRLVPGDVFSRLGSPLFERIPLDWFRAVVIDGEVLRPAEVRAAAIAVAGGRE